MLAMTRDEREAFLADPHVAILALERGQGEPPLVAPIWYWYEPGAELIALTGGGSEKARLAAQSGRGSLIVQREELPPRYVAVDVDVHVDPNMDADERRKIVARYLPPDAIERHLASIAEAGVVMLRMTPRRWRTADLAKVGS